MKHLFFVEQPYSFSILRPLEKAAIDRGDQVGWFLYNLGKPDWIDPVTVLCSTKEVQAFSPDSVIAPGNWVPHFFPGLKVQVFHGFGIEKKGHFNIRGLFDLYCTHGPLTTEPFEKLQKKHPHFKVVETGWPKLDPWANATGRSSGTQTPRKVLYAPTFSPSLTSAPALLEEWRTLSRSPQYSVTAKFHPLESPQIIASYKAIGANLKVAETSDILDLISQSDVVVSDTSSAVAEALVLGVPTLVFRPKVAGPHSRNFVDPQSLENELRFVFNNFSAEKSRGEPYSKRMHPYRDGKSSERVLDAIRNMVFSGDTTIQNKPPNLLRKLRIVKKMKQYRPDFFQEPQ